MIQRFIKIAPGIFRGSAPSPKDVLHLKQDFGINKIVSLDKIAGDKISRACKLLGIKQVKLYIDGSRKSLLNFLHHDLKKLLEDGGPTFIHCAEGKDRTGLAAALYKCKYMGIDSDDAIKEAKLLGFGIGVDPKIIHTYEKLIRSCKKNQDTNNADIVSNEREYISDNRDSFLDEGHQGSFSPYLSVTKQNPMDAVYKYIDDQSPTRENYKQKYPIDTSHETDLPMVGQYNNDAGVAGFGPTLNPGGFIYD